MQIQCVTNKWSQICREEIQILNLKESGSFALAELYTIKRNKQQRFASLIFVENGFLNFPTITIRAIVWQFVLLTTD